MKRTTTLLLALAALGASTPALAAPPTEPIDAIVCRGTSAEGFSYWWGGECWCSNGCTPDLTNCQPGVCTPNAGSTGCPDCTHSGTYGADCSGFVSKAWQVPDPYATNACNVPRYTASSFTANHSYWNVVSMNELQPADAVASQTHVILVIGYEDSAGENEVVEAKGCVYGIVRHSRTFSSSYSGARRINLTECTCAEGQSESESCGDCGTRTRTCEASCTWSAWSPCEGPDPAGADAACATDGEGQCAEGTRRCVAGWNTCQPTPPSTEVCDGVDNDCDGEVDNGTPESLGEGYTCLTACGEGTSQCVGGAVVCVGPDDQTCDATGPTGPTDNPDDATGSCSCQTDSPGALPAFAMAFLLGLLWIRRRTRLGK